MPVKITMVAILSGMSTDLLKYYLRGYSLSTEGNKNTLRMRLGTFIGIGNAWYLYDQSNSNGNEKDDKYKLEDF